MLEIVEAKLGLLDKYLQYWIDTKYQIQEDGTIKIFPTFTFEKWIEHNILVMKRTKFAEEAIEGASKACNDMGIQLQINVCDDLSKRNIPPTPLKFL